MDVEAKWIEFQFTDLNANKMIRIRGFSGTAQQRRTKMRKQLREYSQTRGVSVTKRTWLKGAAGYTAVEKLIKTVPASNKGV